MDHGRGSGRVRRHVFALLAAATLAAAGCGGGSDTTKGDYVKQVNAVGQTLQRELSSLGGAISTQSDPQGIARQLGDGATTLDAAAKKLGEIDPPSDATGAHRQIVDGVHRLAQTFRTGAREARGGRLADLVKTFGAISDSAGVREIAQGTKALKAAGYDVQ